MERKIVFHWLAIGQVRGNGRLAREAKEAEAVRAGKAKCYQVRASGAGLPSHLIPGHRPEGSLGEVMLTTAGANPERGHSCAMLEPGVEVGRDGKLGKWGGWVGGEGNSLVRDVKLVHPRSQNW